MAAVLITVTDGTVDYISDGDVNVVLVDFDRYDMDRAFPDDVDVDLANLKTLPHMPWVRTITSRLKLLRKDLTDRIRTNE